MFSEEDVEEYFVVRRSDEKIICSMSFSQGKKHVFYLKGNRLLWDVYGKDMIIVTPEHLKAMMEAAGYKDVLA